MQRLRQFLPAVCLLAAIAGLAGSYLSGGLVAVLLATDIPAEAKVERLRSYFESWGALSPLVYLLMVTAEVIVAPIPGTLVYLPGGAIFGGWWGGTLALLGNVLGAGIACQLSRSMLGRGCVEQHLSGERLRALEQHLGRRGWMLVVLLRVNPLTSSDLVSYAAGLTRMPVRTLMAGTALGMAPLCYAQAHLSQQLFAAFPWLVWPLVAICFAYLALVVRVVARMQSRQLDREATGIEVPQSIH